MAENEGLDPFLWDLDRVVKELCTPARTFDLPSAAKLPDPEILKAALIESEVDGEALLTNDDLDKANDLASMLGFKKIPQRNALQQAVRFLRTKSFEYRTWKQAQIVQEQLIPGFVIETPRQSEDFGSSVVSRDASVPLPSLRESIEELVKSEAPLESGSPTDLRMIASRPNGFSSGGKRDRESTRNADAARDASLDGRTEDDAAEPPKKKKRVVPVTLSAAPFEQHRAFIPTEADTLLRPSTRPHVSTEAQRADAEGGKVYLGTSRLDQVALLRLPEDDSDLSGQSFVQLSHASAPPGRRRVVYRVLKIYLQTRKDSFGAVDIVDPDSVEDVLPLFGESDEEYDSETWEEIKEEEKERQKLALHGKRWLGLDEVNLIIEESTSRIRADWTERKLPKLESRSYRLWTGVRRNNTRFLKIKQAQDFLSSLERRIAKICEEIRTNQWSKKKEVEQQMASVEPSVMQREEQIWTINLLSNPVQPLRPIKPVARPQRKAKPQDSQELSDEESLSSGSDDLRKFIVRDDDDDERLRPRTVARRKPRTPPASGGFRTTLLGSTARNPLEVRSSPLRESSSQPALPGSTIELLQATLEEWGAARRYAILHLLRSQTASSVWKSICDLTSDSERKLGTEPLFDLVRLYYVYTRHKKTRIHLTTLDVGTLDRLRTNKVTFVQICSAIMRLESPRGKKEGIQAVLITPSQSTNTTPVRLSDRRLFVDDDRSGSEGEQDDSPTRNRRPIIRDRAAEDFRDEVKREREEQERRKLILRQRLAQFDPVGSQSPKLIINESKQDEDALVYVTDDIAGRIKSHQVEGVRFMWDQVVAGDAKTRKGCLLAHTMGLGKTMQVITLLVAIAEASQSPDPTAFSQIPPRLRQGRTLVLCPPGLVDNWIDELLMWAPDGVLGQLTKIHAKTNKEQAVRDWASNRGVAVVGYTVFTKIIQNYPELAEVLHREADLVVADEAHKLKNPTSQVHAATAQFHADSRIALTGSPLANKVDDYYAMINWVSPNFLGPPEEFRQRYSNPIRTGLFVDSHPSEKRLALRKLSILKRVAAPKMHRMGIFSIRHELPVKKEFILYMPLTDLQLRAYHAYIEGIPRADALNVMNSQAKVWSFVGYLGSLLAHPKIFKAHLEGVKDNVQAAHARTQKSAASNNRSAAAVPGDEEAALPQGLISNALTIVNSVRDISDAALSWKILLLSAILDEAERLGERILVFSQSLRTLDFLEELFKQQKRNWARLDGQTEVVQRQAAIKTFNSDEGADIYLISTRAGGVGLNLQGANRVVIFDFKYSPTDEQQAVGRAYRIGQQKPVFVYWLIVDGTFETVVQQRSVFKMQLSSRVVDKKNPVAWAKRSGDYFAMPSIPEPQDLSAYHGQDPLLDSLFQNGSLAGGISRIDPIETFEREEPEDFMTAEDKREVEQEIHEFMHRGDPGHLGVRDRIVTAMPSDIAMNGLDSQANVAAEAITGDDLSAIDRAQGLVPDAQGQDGTNLEATIHTNKDQQAGRMAVDSSRGRCSVDFWRISRAGLLTCSRSSSTVACQRRSRDHSAVAQPR
jgi:SNF2 family DNA or RNA helicase